MEAFLDRAVLVPYDKFLEWRTMLNNTVENQYKLSASDRAFFESRGISLQAVGRQLATLTSQRPPRIHADRPCTSGDGVMCLSQEDRARFVEKGIAALATERFDVFIPASGAASRMFQDLSEAKKNGADFLAKVPELVEGGDRLGKAVLSIFAALPSFPFFRELQRDVLERTRGQLDLERSSARDVLTQGYGETVIAAMIGEDGLNLARKPKALIPFHRYSGEEVRSALCEHLHMVADLVAGKARECGVHFTCSPEHVAAFETEAKAIVAQLKAQRGVSIEVSFSVQAGRTDTVCVTPEGEMCRENGVPVLRPGGHGALLHNLAQLGRSGARFVNMNNIDNVHPIRTRGEFLESNLMLLGVLSEVQEIARTTLNCLKTGEAHPDTLETLHVELNKQIGLSISDARWKQASYEDKKALLIEALDRPIRIVGVVKNTGEAGGGPFWVREASGALTRQLVEKHELDPENSAQQELFTKGSHFNPVRLMCGLADSDGKPFELGRFVNEDAMMLGSKQDGGVKRKIIEWPGLWNGSMAKWITLFVEVDGSTFAPVKSVLDLSRPAHQC
jgi:hypothetical protein